MSIHFAPQWVKPIKPTGSALAPTSDTHAQVVKQPATPVSPFPALGQPRAGSPTTVASSNPPLSYSRVTHAPASPSFSGEGYFPHAGDGPNGGAHPSPYPFRYSREQILGIWDEDKFKERPIELMQIAETDNGQVLVSKAIVQPVGLRELSEVEKRILSTSVHPPVVSRRQPQAHTNTSHGNNSGEAALPRRAPQPAMKDSSNLSTAPSRGTAFGGFGRGEGGAFGGSKYTSGALGEGRQPGAIGGGFGGVGKRTTRREEDPTRPSPASAAPSWRSVRNQSGTFEGVLGFGSSSVPSTIEAAPANGRLDSDRGGWGTAEKQWRAAPNDERPLTIPTTEPSTQSVIATASATPVGERDAQLRENTPGPRSGTQTPQAQEPQDLGNVNWYYRDPNGQEQGPFTGTQMHEWYSHSYFQDELPVRRENEVSFHKLSELKTNTNNSAQPFLAPVRPRLPPNLPIPLAALQATGPAPGSVASPGGLNDTFGRLNMGNLPAPQPQYHPNAYQGGQFGQQPQYNNQFTSVPFGGQQWNPAPGTQSPARGNGAYGSIGPQSAYAPYGPAIGTPPIQRPDVFASPIGQPSPWNAPVNPATTWQQQPVQQQMTPTPIAHQPQQQFNQQSHPIPQQHAAVEQSYFPPTEDILPEQTAPTEEYDDVHDESLVEDYLDSGNEFEDELLSQTDAVVEEQEQEQEEQEEEIVEEQPEEKEEAAPKVAPASVWAKTPKSTPRKAANEPTPAQSSKLPPPHASLPPKPATAPIKSDATKESSPSSAAATPVEKTMAKVAPWATADKHAHGPSLREIQEAEARQSAARKQARVEARAASQASIITTNDDLPASMTWGLPSSKGSVPPPSSSTPPTPAWGGGSEGPKKTLKQIQEEEERRNLKLARQQQTVVSATTPAAAKRGYADLAATHAPTLAQAAAAAAAGWTTVGAGGKNAAAPVKPAPLPPKPVTAVKPAAVVSKPAAKAPVADEQPSIEFIRWTKQALTGLQVPVDDFISMLLSFPVDPPASSRAEQQEIIADSVYASSSTLDGRRFAQEFMTRRKADAKRDTTKPVAKIGSLADVVKTQPKAPAADVGFKVVKAKKKRS
ncbi:hypothetical protein CspeluHIS016_0208860 [Cutaneotrichosporon spelunceum]|uniref:GYF domain-containing protein n=1 Tax=Cutaneotrichosporon spelunceum TaxID=1672016 RepID=A0AAD3TS47_9TREE|nr:hypothetical protein CspeluHIS016_0208860 [Cutaneotrichosporon spelunceum]